jgi:hypothetical protein
MVANISEVAAKLGNVKVFRWALWNEYFHEEYWDDNIFVDIAENGHIKILEFGMKFTQVPDKNTATNLQNKP